MGVKSWLQTVQKRLTGAAVASPIYGGGNGGSWFGLSSTAWSPEAWQSDDHRSVDSVLANNSVFACVTLIASDIGKLRPKLVELQEGIWTESSSPAFSPVLRKPNRFQNHLDFKEAWVISKLLRGNTYVLKERDNRGVVVAMYVLDPMQTTPLVAPDGAVYYELGEDNLVGLQEASVIVPASEIIHDRMNCLFHPLVGISPLYASAATADQGLKIQKNSSQFFGNNSTPGGILTAPGVITEPTALRIKTQWEKNYGGTNSGRVAVLGDGLKFEAMRMTAVESQMAEQLNLSAKVICSAFHVPPFMIGLGEEPTYSNGETRTGHYYSQCLQSHIEHMEESLDDGLGLLGAPKDGRILGVELDLDGLLRMDTKTQMEALKVGVDGALMTPNEARASLNLKPLTGGDTVYMQQQNYSIEALNNRPPPPDLSAPAPAPAAPADPVGDAVKDMQLQFKELDAQRAAESASRHADVVKQIEVAVQALASERAAVAAEADALAKQQEGFDVAQQLAQSLIKKLTSNHAA